MGKRRETGDDANRKALAGALRQFANCITETSDSYTRAQWGLIRMRDAAYSAVGFLDAGEPGRAREVLAEAIRASDEALGVPPRRRAGSR